MGQLEFWQEACKSFGPRGPSSRLGAFTGSAYYDRSRDREMDTPRSPMELGEIRARQRKAEIEHKIAELFKTAKSL